MDTKLKQKAKNNFEKKFFQAGEIMQFLEKLQKM